MIQRLAEGARNLKLWQVDAIGLGLCGALGAAWYAVGLAPLSEARAQRATLSGSITEMQGDLVRLNGIKRAKMKALASARSKLETSALKLAPIEQVNQRVGALTGLATSNDLRVDEIKPGTPTLHERHTAVPIQVAGQGGFQGIASFLHKLRTEFPDIGVSQFEVKGEPAALDRPARYSLQLVWYAAPAVKPSQK